MRASWIPAILCFLLVLAGCEDTAQKSADAAREHVAFLKDAAEQDVQEVQKGLPEGAKHLEGLFKDALPGFPDPQSAHKQLNLAREQVQDLRVAKSTFFLVAQPDGKIIRNDRDQDLMVDKNLFEPFPDLKAALTKGYVESRGSMPEAAGVRGREDGQWVAAVPVKVDGAARGIYATGWSWSAYAYRLQNAIRSKILGETEEGAKVPLVYVYVVVGDAVFGEPVAPTVNAEAIAKEKPLAKAQGDQPFVTKLEIDRREFGLAVAPVKALGKDVGVAVLRSET